MTIAEYFCKTLNRFFPIPKHSNYTLNIDSSWKASEDYDYAASSLAVFNRITDHLNKNKDSYLPQLSFVKDNIVVDAGTGLGGRTVWLLEQEANHVLSLVIKDCCDEEGSDCDAKAEHIAELAKQFIQQKNNLNKANILKADSKDLPIHNASVDSVVIGNCFCCAKDDLAFLQECHRILKKGGKLYLEFRPWHHPYGAFLQNKIYIPWVHKLFSIRTLEKVADQKFIANQMTLNRFENLLTLLPFQVNYIHYEPLQPWLKTMTMLPVFQEYFVNRVICVLEKVTTRT